MSIAEKFEVIADEVYEKGRKDEQDKFWDIITNNNTRTNYENAFSYWGNLEYIRPPYVIQPQGRITNIFRYCYGLKKVEAEYFDFSKATFEEIYDTSGLYYTFAYNSALEEVEDLGFPPAYLYSTFRQCINLKKVHILRINENCLINSNVFDDCGNLEYIRIEGAIGKSGFNVADCINLTKDSLLSILTALSKDSTIASGKSITFATVHKAVIEADSDCLEQLNLAISAGWTVAYA